MRKGYSVIEESEKKHFDKMAEKYDINYGYKNQFTKYKINKKILILVDFLKHLKLSKSAKIIEIGCGTGEYTIELSKKLPKIYIEAMDISKNIIKVARQKSKACKNIKYKVKSFYKSGYKDNSVDVIYGFYILHHLDIDKTVKEAFRILKPGGLIFFYEPNILNALVYLIKSNKYLKRVVGDSPDEWGVNPLTVKNRWRGFEVLNNATTEYLPPNLPLKLETMVYLDSRVEKILRYIPVINKLGGSVNLSLRKSDGLNEIKLQ